ncbi:FAD-linked oxidase C-terminal domain-containing protein [Streptomyces gamaensis]|uniref:FAD-linked oxidase C-terminal domain-containing protein n=1 Tax=Streptomyces gamaensis TaxID=1763542 RepID=A0ABW0Z4U8_9ACTN
MDDPEEADARQGFDADGLERALRAAVRGPVSFDAQSRALVTMDASNYRRVPLGVVAPRDADDVAAALAVCRERGVPVVPRGGGTSIAGQATGTGLVLDFTRHMNAITALDPEARTAVVQPGVVLDALRAAAAPYGLTFGPDPSTHSRCTLGGMIGNNACGAHSVAWGTTADNVRELEVLTYGGERARLARGYGGLPPRLADELRSLVDGELALLRTGFPELARRGSGYALDALLPERRVDVARAFTGSEGTIGVLTAATVRLVEAPGARALAVLGYPDESAAADAAQLVLPHGPLTVEGMAADVAGRAAADLPDGAAWLFVEAGGATPAEAGARAAALVRAAGSGTSGRTVVTDPAGQRALWRVREDAAGTATRLPDGTEAWPGWEDCAVPPARLGAYLREFRELLARYGLRGAPYGHYGEGCVHVRIDFDLLSAEGVRRYRAFSADMAELVLAHGGSLSGEHGDGQARAELLPRMYGPQLVGLFERVKDLWDPDGGLNPGILVRPHRLDDNLRFAVLPSRPVPVEFGYRQDGGDFTAAVRRCVGVAKCRDTAAGTGVMCPSFRVTGEEKHSTRGRARLLHEMLAGELVRDGWRSQEVRDALDLCLACKGCRSDCPVGVDMATYKAEFLHHYYAGRRRPRSHVTLGRLPQWLRLAAPLAPVLNAAARLPAVASLAKRTAGITPERDLPPLAGRTFRTWWRERARKRAGTGGPLPLGGTGAFPAVGARPDAGGQGARSCGGDGPRTGPGAAAPTVVTARPDAGGHGPRLRGGDGPRSGAAAPTVVTARPDAGGQGARSRGGDGPRSGAAAPTVVRARPDVGGLGARPRGEDSPRPGPRPGAAAPTVVLWPDTFTDHLAPDVGISAVTVLEAAGLRVAVPPANVCCGLTYISTGQLDAARAVLRRTLDAIAPALAAGLPVTVLEPGCAATLVTDLPELLPDDPRAARLAAAVRTFARTLREYAPSWQPPRLDRPVAGQTHCHQHAVLGDAAERHVREQAGLTGGLSAGCCGLAGDFGFEPGHYGISVACAEEQLLPSVRAATADTLLLADGYSCRTQLEQLTGRRARHLAQALARALRDSPSGQPRPPRGNS